MKKAIQKYSGTTLVLIIVAICIALCIAHPQASEKNDVHYFSELESHNEVETETETVIAITMEEYIHNRAELANNAILKNRQELLEELEKQSEMATESATESFDEFVPYEFIKLSEDVQVGIKNAADQYEVSYDLIIAICMQESSLNANCVGDGGRAFGLGQIREEYWSEVANDLELYEWKTDAVQNATIVCYIMSRQMVNFGQTMESALNIYRHGVTQDIVEPDGKTYVQHIKNNLDWIESEKEKRNG